ncbi:MAG TPA: helix-turn-helix domain-containing protein [Sphingomonas sp.]|nr:helix-turn-helix domain-containing protein [Sphingomonas sp.]
MITAIREVRRAKNMTLDDVARACVPPTTAQTIGRLETGTRTVSVGWLNRIAAALGVTASDLVTLPDRPDVAVAALLGPDGASAPKKPATIAAPVPAGSMVAVRVTGAVGDYRTGDEIWCDRLAPDAFSRALNRDVLVPRPAGRYLFARLIGRDGDKLHLLPLGAGTRQQVVTDPPWIATAVTLVRTL